MAPTDAIWLFSFSFDGVFACHLVAPTTPVSIPIYVFVVAIAYTSEEWQTI